MTFYDHATPDLVIEIIFTRDCDVFGHILLRIRLFVADVLSHS